MLTQHLSLVFAAQVKASEDPTWFSEHSTLIVGVVGIVISGFVGPSVTSLLTGRRERARQHTVIVDARRQDLRVVLDEAAKILAEAVGRIRPLLQAELAGEPLPPGPTEFIRTLVPLGQRLRLRLSGEHEVVRQFDAAREALTKLSEATESQDDFDSAVGIFEARRETFLEAGRAALHAPIASDSEL